jgi:hypothetical protein
MQRQLLAIEVVDNTSLNSASVTPPVVVTKLSEWVESYFCVKGARKPGVVAEKKIGW